MSGGARAALVLLAAGAGSRVGHATNKVLLPLAGRPVLAWSLARAAGVGLFGRIVVVVRDGEQDTVSQAVTDALAGVPGTPPEQVDLVTGGATRHASEWRALSRLAEPVRRGDVDVVAIHDGARPLASAGLFRAVVEAARTDGGALPTVPQPGLLPREEGSPPAGAVAVQTPQAFRAGPLLAAYAAADADGFDATDTAGCVERYTDLVVRGVPGSAANVKITYPEDVALAERLLAGQPD